MFTSQKAGTEPGERISLDRVQRMGSGHALCCNVDPALLAAQNVQFAVVSAATLAPLLAWLSFAHCRVCPLVAAHEQRRHPGIQHRRTVGGNHRAFADAVADCARPHAERISPIQTYRTETNSLLDDGDPGRSHRRARRAQQTMVNSGSMPGSSRSIRTCNRLARA